MTSLRSHSKSSDTKRVLIVDDDADLREAFDEVLRIFDYDVLSARDGAEAMDLLQSLSDEELPNLILLDYQMPRMDGVTFSQLKARDRRIAPIPLVLLSACGERAEIKAMKERAVVEAHVQKPLDLDHLLDLTHHYVQQPSLS